MPSHLRVQTDASTFEATFDSQSSPTSPPHKKQKMTVTQTFRLAHTARGKLSAEASRGEYDLRVLVGHANLLDNLMIELAEAEKEQEDFYDSNLRSSSPYAHTVEDLEIPDESDSDSDDEDVDADSRSDYSDFEEEHFARMAVPTKHSTSRPSLTAVTEDLDEEEHDEDEDEYDDLDHNNPDLSLSRTHSHIDTTHELNVPELVHDSDDSDDESQSLPPSPDYSSVTITDFAMATRKPTTTTTAEEALHENGFWIPEQQPQMIAAC